jgi:hypothetical protein
MSEIHAVCEKELLPSSSAGCAAHNTGMTAKTKPSVQHSTDSTALSEVSWIAADGSSHDAIATPRLLDKELYLAKKIRTGNRYPKQRNYHGHNWFGNTQQQIWFESLFERHALLWLDHTRDIVAIAGQPMTMTFGDGSEHTPDFVALLANHRQVVYDVKPSRLVPKAQAQFDKTAELCRTVGWGFEVLSDLPRQLHINLDWIASFRHPRFAAPPGETRVLLDALRTPMALEEAAALLPPLTGKPAIYHMVWMGQLHLDLNALLTNSTLISKENFHAHS